VGRRLSLTAWLVAAIMALAGCGPGTTETDKTGEDDQPARLVQVEGESLSGVALSGRAAERVGIKSEPVREVSTAGATTKSKAVPVAALIYDKNGDVWVYTTARLRTYVRQRVTIAQVEGDLAILESGPAVGTAVVTVGAAELFGSESGVEGA
jgi:hypothetical protein